MFELLVHIVETCLERVVNNLNNKLDRIQYLTCYKVVQVRLRQQSRNSNVTTALCTL